MPKGITKAASIAVIDLLQGIANYSHASLAEVTDATLDVLYVADGGAFPPMDIIFDASGSALAQPVGTDAEESILYEMFNKQWWEQESFAPWAKYRVSWSMANLIFDVVIKYIDGPPYAEAERSYCLSEARAVPLAAFNAAIEAASHRAVVSGQGKGEEIACPSFLDSSHPRFPYKLAAAFKAWEAVRDQPGKTPLQALKSWLEANAADLGLLKARGELNKQGIEECAAVANWQQKGGAPKTPGG